MHDSEGVKFTPVFFGDRKNDLARTEPLNKEAHAALQNEVDRLGEMFVSTVGRNRDLASETIRSTEAAVFFGENGPASGLSDGVATFDDILGELQAEVSESSGSIGTAAQRGPVKETSMSNAQKEAEAKAAAEAEAKTTAEAEAKTTAEAEAKATAEATAKDAAEPDNVVSIETARNQGARDADEKTKLRIEGIRRACQLAGQPERFGEFLDTELSVDQVGKKLLDERAAAAGEHTDGHHGSEADAKPVKISSTAIYSRWNDKDAIREPA